MAKGVLVEAYNAFFSPSNYMGAENGMLSSSGLGFSHLGSFAATTANLESLYYGKLIKTFKEVLNNSNS